MTTSRGREKIGESEENKERDVEGDTCHVCTEREKKIFTIVNSTECNYAALQLLLLVPAGKKNVFVYFNDSRVYREKKKSLQLSTQLNVVVWHCNCCCCLCWLEKKMYLCILMIHVCIERKKILFNSQLTPAVWHCSCCCYYAGWKKFFINVF